MQSLKEKLDFAQEEEKIIEQDYKVIDQFEMYNRRLGVYPALAIWSTLLITYLLLCLFGVLVWKWGYLGLLIYPGFIVPIGLVAICEPLIHYLVYKKLKTTKDNINYIKSRYTENKNKIFNIKSEINAEDEKVLIEELEAAIKLISQRSLTKEKANELYLILYSETQSIGSWGFVHHTTRYYYNRLDKIKEILNDYDNIPQKVYRSRTTPKQNEKKIEEEKVAEKYEILIEDIFSAIKKDTRTKLYRPITNAPKLDFAALNEKRKRIGDLGEKYVFEWEIKHLQREGLTNHTDKVQILSKGNDTLGYDIISVSADGNKKYIEVKATTGAPASFEISKNEVACMKTMKNYFIYYLVNFDLENEIGDIIRIDCTSQFDDYYILESTAYKAVPRNQVKYP